MHYTDMRLIFELQVVAAVPTLEDLTWEHPPEPQEPRANPFEEEAAVELKSEQKVSTFSRVFGWGRRSKKVSKEEAKTPPATPPRPKTPPERELMERHLVDLGALSVALGSGCCHKCAEALGNRMIEHYVERFSGRSAAGLDRVAERYEMGRQLLVKCPPAQRILLFISGLEPLSLEH